MLTTTTRTTTRATIRATIRIIIRAIIRIIIRLFVPPNHVTTTQEAKKCGKPILYARFGTLKEMQLSFFLSKMQEEKW